MLFLAIFYRVPCLSLGRMQKIHKSQRVEHSKKLTQFLTVKNIFNVVLNYFTEHHVSHLVECRKCTKVNMLNTKKVFIQVFYKSVCIFLKTELLILYVKKTLFAFRQLQQSPLTIQVETSRSITIIITLRRNGSGRHADWEMFAEVLKD